MPRDFYTDDSLTRELGDLHARIARLERRHIQDDVATTQGKRLLGSLFVLIGRRLRGEDGVHN